MLVLPKRLEQLLADYNCKEFPAFTNLGGYPFLYFYSSGDCLCASCLNEKVASGDEGVDLPEDYTIFYEGSPEYCCECNEEIESAYGDPEVNKIMEAISDTTRYHNCLGKSVLFPLKYLNPYDEDKQLVTEEGCKLVYDYLAEEYDWYSDFCPTTIIADYISVATVKSAIKAIELRMQQEEA